MTRETLKAIRSLDYLVNRLLCEYEYQETTALLLQPEVEPQMLFNVDTYEMVSELGKAPNLSFTKPLGKPIVTKAKSGSAFNLGVKPLKLDVVRITNQEEE